MKSVKPAVRLSLVCAVSAALSVVAVSSSALAAIGGPYTPDANTVALYHLNGSTVDASGNGHNASLNTLASWASSAKFGGGLQGTGGFTASVGTLSSHYTVEGWFKPTTIRGDDPQYLIGGMSQDWEQRFYTAITIDGELMFGAYGYDGWYRDVVSGVLTANAWNHIAFASEQVSGNWVSRIYVNNALVGSVSTIASPIHNLTVGACPWSQEQWMFTGQIDEVRVSNVAYKDFTAVPEPASLVALTSALVALGGVAARRRRS